MLNGNYYEILGISQNATTQEIRKAYASKIKTYTNERYPQEFQLIREAYETLMDPDLRSEYDEYINPTVRTTDRSYQNSYESSTNGSQANAEKSTESSSGNFWGCICCIIIILYFYLQNS